MLVVIVQGMLEADFGLVCMLWLDKQTERMDL